eukprot:XP_011666148.1 PREDICTED: uncharacterized protein LOC105439147 [Strongylocentrotus purpuratus]
MTTAMVILLMFGWGAAATKPIHPNVQFLGTGYNILEGNPGGQDLNEGGLDPGLKVTRQVFSLSYDEEKLTDDNAYSVPDEIIYTKRDGSSEGCTVSSVYGSRSYQEELKIQSEVEGGFEKGLAGFEFGASAAYRTISDKLEVEEKLFATYRTLEIFGEGRILSASEDVSFSDEFASQLCALPEMYPGHETTYNLFLDDWGTHVVTQATFGTATQTFLQYQQSSIVYMQAREIGASASIGGAYKGFSGSLSITGSYDVNFREVEAAFDGEKYSTTRGSLEQNEPITYHLVGMDQLLDKGYFIPNQGTCTPINNLKESLQLAMKGYPEYKGISISSDPDEYRQPLTWPDGEYTLPMTATGCPEGGVSWAEGRRLFDTDDNNPENSWDPEDIHLNLPIKELSQMEMKFCTKKTAQSADFRRVWQSGSYCIYKYGQICPKGFEEGSIYWDDNDINNGNDFDGTVPEGVYDHNTKIYFCCRTDDEPTKPIILPVDHDFVLLTPTGTCQEVLEMNVAKEMFHWDTEGHSEVSGEHPYPGLKNAGSLKDVEIIFCYYQHDEPTTNPDRKRRSGNENDDEQCQYFQEIAQQQDTNPSDPTSSNNESYRHSVNLLFFASLTFFAWAVNYVM